MRRGVLPSSFLVVLLAWFVSDCRNGSPERPRTTGVLSASAAPPSGHAAPLAASATGVSSAPCPAVEPPEDPCWNIAGTQSEIDECASRTEQKTGTEMERTFRVSWLDMPPTSCSSRSCGGRKKRGSLIAMQSSRPASRTPKTPGRCMAPHFLRVGGSNARGCSVTERACWNNGYQVASLKSISAVAHAESVEPSAE